MTGGGLRVDSEKGGWEDLINEDLIGPVNPSSNREGTRELTAYDEKKGRRGIMKKDKQIGRERAS